MRTEQPLAALHRRLRIGPEPESDDGVDDEADEDEISAPSWVPDGQPSRGKDWLAAIRADPGRAGGIALGLVAALAVLVTLFTLVRS